MGLMTFATIRAALMAGFVLVERRSGGSITCERRTPEGTSPGVIAAA